MLRFFFNPFKVAVLGSTVFILIGAGCDPTKQGASKSTSLSQAVSRAQLLTPASIAVTGTLSFGSVNVGATSGNQTMTVTNLGQTTATGCVASFTGTHAAEFSIFSDTCLGRVNGSGTCNLVLRVTPAGGGLRSGTFNYACSSTGASSTSNGLTTTGLTAPSLSFSPNTIAFGSVAAGVTTADTAVTISNSGG